MEPWLKWLVAAACCVVIAGGGYFALAKLDEIKNAEAREHVEEIVRCRKFIDERDRRNRQIAPEISESDDLLKLRLDICRDQFPAIAADIDAVMKAP